MFEFAVLAVAVLTNTQDPVIVSIREPRRPDFMSSDFEARCGRRTVILSGVGGSGPGAAAPAVKFNGRRLDLVPELQAFLLGERATYRVYAVCPDTAPAFQIRIYRAMAASDGQVSYDLWALDVTGNGRIIDRGRESASAETFWYR